jgi:hypothetical protein
MKVIRIKVQGSGTEEDCMGKAGLYSNASEIYVAKILTAKSGMSK